MVNKDFWPPFLHKYWKICRKLGGVFKASKSKIEKVLLAREGGVFKTNTTVSSIEVF